MRSPLLTIVVGYSNVGYDTEYDWSSEIFSGDYSLSQYYTDMLGGVFIFSPAPESSKYDGDTNLNTADKENDGVIHVILDSEHGDWSDNTDEAVLECQRSFADAINKTDEFVDYSSYDTDGNGYITYDELSICFIVAGAGASCSVTDRIPGFWAHNYSFFENVASNKMEFPTPDDTIVNWYSAFGERMVYDYDDEDYHSDEVMTSSNNKITDTPVANTGAGAGLGAVAAVTAGALITVVSRKRKED